jgi:hypothetical protein
MREQLRRAAYEPRLRALMRTVASGTAQLSRSLETPRDALLAVSELARRYGGDRPAVAESSPLTPFELRAFSQNGEDGILAELLFRTGQGGSFFIEFGAGDGHENNCVFLADVMGWSGLFIEADSNRSKRLIEKYEGTRVVARRATVSPESIDSLLAGAGIPDEPDILSIDVDGPDYAIWQGLSTYRPRIVVVEYDGSLGHEQAMVTPSGASIAALRELGGRKGYKLVHTELTGNNAFFVRSDQPGTFPADNDVPLRSPNHYLAGEGSIPRPGG